MLNGVSITDGMRNGLDRIDNALKGYKISPADIEEIKGAYKEACYQWLQANAAAVIAEDMIPRAARMKYVNQMITELPKKTRYMYPAEWIEK